MGSQGESERSGQGEVEPTPPGGSVKRFFARKEEEATRQQGPRPDKGIAQIPSTVLTVEYVDDSAGMDAALRELCERLRKVEEQLAGIQETQSRVVSAVNQQAKDIGRIVESLGRRIDRLYRRATGGEAPAARQDGPAVEEEEEAPPAPEAARDIGPPLTTGLAPEVAGDPEHQNAYRIARVLAADLEAYHEDAVREGVLYGTFYSVLREPIEKARKAYEQRVSAQIVESYDYFSKALDELIARKHIELEEEGVL